MPDASRRGLPLTWIATAVLTALAVLALSLPRAGGPAYETGATVLVVGDVLSLLAAALSVVFAVMAMRHRDRWPPATQVGL